ncbi:MAG: PIN domain-containing protein [Chthoniobacteraceae bacterium]
MKVYLDVCCLGRLFEESDQTRMRRESDAIQKILDLDVAIVGSEIVRREVSRDTDDERRNGVEMLVEEINGSFVRINARIVIRGTEPEALGFGGFDALHIACPESAGATFLLTTDDKMLRRAKRLADKLNVKIENPVRWVLDCLP